MKKDINGIPVAEMLEHRERARRDPSTAQRGSTLIARWRGGDASIVELDSKRLGVQGHEELGPMQLVQAALGSCLVDVIATRAALEGIELEELSVEVGGTFDVRAYLGVEGAPASGYSALTCTVHLRAPKATADQLEQLRHTAEHVSPVVDTLARPVPVKVVLIPG